MKDFEIRCDESRLETTNLIYGKFTLGPFLPGQATTFGNALRRSLLAELSGLAITAFEIIGVMQEFATLPGLRESILDLSLNLKQIVLTGVLPQSTPPIGFLNVRGPAIIRASDLKLPAGVYCTSPNQYIATLGSNGMLHIKFVVSIGKGYSIQPYSIYRSLSKIKLQPASNLDNTGVVPLKPGASEQNTSAQTTYARQVLSATADSLESNGVSVAERPESEAAGLQGQQAQRYPHSVKGENGGGSRYVAERRSKDGVRESAAEPPYSKGVTKGRGQEQILPSKGFQSTFFTKENNSKNNSNGGSRQGRACAAAGVFDATLPRTKFRGTGFEVSSDTPYEVQGQRSVENPSYYKSSSRRANSGARDSTGKGNSDSSYINIQTQLFQRITPHQVLPIDAVFTPVTQVNFLTEVNDRFETARENIVLEIWTNGSIHPKRALEEATLSLVQNFDTLLKKIQQASSFYKGLRYWTYLQPFKSSLGISLADRRGESSDVSLSSGSGIAKVSMQGRGTKVVDEFQGNGVMESVAEGHRKQRVTRQTQGEILRNKRAEKSEEELLEKLVKREGTQSIYNLDIGNLNLSLQTFIFLKKAKIHTLLQLLTWISLKENHICHLESDLLNERIIEELNDVIKQFAL